MRQPPGFDDQSGRVCKLAKGLYGLKQSGRAWNIKLNKILLALGFTRVPADVCVYVRILDNSIEVIIIHVDDMALMADTTSRMSHLKGISKIINAGPTQAERIRAGRPSPNDGPLTGPGQTAVSLLKVGLRTVE